MNSTQISFIGTGSLSNLKNIIDKHNAKRVLIVAGKKSFSLSGAQVKIKKILSNIEITLFNDFQSNPKIEDVMNGMQLVYLENPDLIIKVSPNRWTENR